MSTSAQPQPIPQPQPSPLSRFIEKPAAWEALALQASVEQNPAKMSKILAQLFAAIDKDRLARGYAVPPLEEDK
jgi:hypothetical protein